MDKRPEIPPALNDAAQLARDRARDAQARFNRLVTPSEKAAFWSFGGDPESRVIRSLRLLGLLTAFPLWGAIWGFKRAYRRILEPRGRMPDLAPLAPPARWGMIVGALLFSAVGLALLFYVGLVADGSTDPRGLLRWAMLEHPALTSWLFFWGVIALVSVALFNRWRNRVYAIAALGDQYGTARLATDDELAPRRLANTGGGFVAALDEQAGGAITYPKDGHFLTVAGTRSGKGVNLIVPNLLTDQLAASWVVVDPKGENAAITAAQMAKRKSVHVLNPWGILPDALGGFPPATFNPLDLVDPDSPHLVDDVDLIAEMIVPLGAGGDESDHWNNRARAIIAGMLVHLMTADKHAQERNLLTLWTWLRYPFPDLEGLAQDMSESGNKVAAATGDDLGTMMLKAERELAGVMSTAKRYTDFLKSPALARSLESSSFDLDTLAQGKTAVYVVIPAERLNTHRQWLRLVVTCCMRAVVRSPGQRVCFLLDEAFSLGYISEVSTLLGLGAGYGISIWNVFQNLTQIKQLYGANWENVLASSAVRQFFGVGDAFTADYLSRYAGQRTFVRFPLFSAGEPQATSRSLFNPDEVRRATRDAMLTFIEQDFPTLPAKLPYFEVPELAAQARPNPYFGVRA